MWTGWRELAEHGLKPETPIHVYLLHTSPPSPSEQSLSTSPHPQHSIRRASDSPPLAFGLADPTAAKAFASGLRLQLIFIIPSHGPRVLPLGSQIVTSLGSALLLINLWKSVNIIVYRHDGTTPPLPVQRLSNSGRSFPYTFEMHPDLGYSFKPERRR